MKANQYIKEELEKILLKDPRVTLGKMFGYPGYFVNRKLFACVYENAIGFKLPQKEVEELILNPSYAYFCPLGRKPMKEWIQISPQDPKEVRNYEDKFQDSINFVESLN